MYECLGNIVNSNNDNLMYNMDVACGQSGSPIFFDEGNGPYANGIVTHKTGLGYNIGYTITGDLIQWLKDNGFVN